MATRKITITLPEDQIEEVRALVIGRREASITRFVQHGVGVAISDAVAWKEMLEEALQQTVAP